jgi:hypothetical protein
LDASLYLTQYADMLTPRKNDNSISFKDDATFFMRPALAHIDYISIKANQSSIKVVQEPDTILGTKWYNNTSNLPQLHKSNVRISLYSDFLQFFQTTGFYLAVNETYDFYMKQVIALEDGVHVDFAAKKVKRATINIPMSYESEFIFEGDIIT